MCVCIRVCAFMCSRLCLTLCSPVDCSSPGSSAHGIFQARILEWVAISSSRGSSWPRDRTLVSWIGRQILYHLATWKALCILIPHGNSFPSCPSPTSWSPTATLWRLHNQLPAQTSARPCLWTHPLERPQPLTPLPPELHPLLAALVTGAAVHQAIAAGPSITPTSDEHVQVWQFCFPSSRFSAPAIITGVSPEFPRGCFPYLLPTTHSRHHIPWHQAWL